MTENEYTESQTAATVGKPRKSLEQRLFSFLSTHWCGNEMVPLHHETFQRGERVAMFLNDGFDIGVGTPDEWIYIFKRDEFKAMALWYLKAWVFKEWFGLRRTLWYWLLHRKCESYKKAGKQ